MGGGSRDLLRSTTARAFAGGDHAKRGYPAFDRERLRVCFADNARYGVLGHREPACLKPFLEPRLGVLAERRGIEVGELRCIDSLDYGTRRVETGIDEHGADDRLQCIRKNRRPFDAAAPDLASAQHDGTSESEVAREARQRVTVDEACSHARE